MEMVDIFVEWHSDTIHVHITIDSFTVSFAIVGSLFFVSGLYDIYVVPRESALGSHKNCFTQ